jgi:hypothetical protein
LRSHANPDQALPENATPALTITRFLPRLTTVHILNVALAATDIHFLSAMQLVASKKHVSSMEVLRLLCQHYIRGRSRPNSLDGNSG